MYESDVTEEWKRLDEISSRLKIPSRYLLDLTLPDKIRELYDSARSKEDNLLIMNFLDSLVRAIYDYTNVRMFYNTHLFETSETSFKVQETPFGLAIARGGSLKCMGRIYYQLSNLARVSAVLRRRVNTRENIGIGYLLCTTPSGEYKLNIVNDDKEVGKRETLESHCGFTPETCEIRDYKTDLSRVEIPAFIDTVGNRLREEICRKSGIDLQKTDIKEGMEAARKVHDKMIAAMKKSSREQYEVMENEPKAKKDEPPRYVA
jgi:hypothetical protein